MIVFILRHLNSKKNLFLLLLTAFYLSLFVFTTKIQAYSIPTFYNQDLPAQPVACSCGDTPSECANSQNDNNCGLERCEGGTAWTKYRRTSCVRDASQEGSRCGAFYDAYDKVYSIGDKCTSGGPYLNPGYCESPWGGPIYRTCCSWGSPSFVAPSACVAFDADGAGDPEGRCPAGYERAVLCSGFGCGQAACGPVAPPPPPRQCDVLNRSYNQCCGTNLSQHVDEYVWDDGSNQVCRYDTGACNQSDPSCGPGSTPPPTPTPTPTPTADTQPPTCNSFTLNGKNCKSLPSGTVCETVKQGDPVNIGVETQDDVRVSTVALFKDNPPAIATFNNSLGINPYGISYGFNSQITPGTYTLIANAQDTSGNPMLGNDVNCRGILRINLPPPLLPTVSLSANTPIQSGSYTTLTWTISNSPTSCTVSNSGSATITSGSWSGTLSGTDVNNTTHTRSITLSNTSSSAQTKTFSINCTNSSGTSSPTSSAAVTVNPLGPNSIDSPATVTKASSTAPWPAINNISVTAGSGGDVMIKPGSCSAAGCSLSDWTLIRSVAQGSSSVTYTLPQAEPAGNYTFGLINTARTQVLAADTTNFIISPGPPPSTGCTITPSNVSTSGGTSTNYTLSGPPGSYVISCPNNTSQTINPGSFNCFNPTEAGPYQTTATWQTSGSTTCSATVNVLASPENCTGRSSWDIITYAFNDPTYDANAWPAQRWDESNPNNTCWAGWDAQATSLPVQSTLASAPNSTQGQVLAVISCWQDSDCNDANACTRDTCQEARSTPGCEWGPSGPICWLAGQGSCRSDPLPRGEVCGTSPNGGNMYCGATTTGSPSGICVDNLCDSNKNIGSPLGTSPNPECNDSNSCTGDTCSPPQTCGEDCTPYAGIGTCQNPTLAYGRVCSTTPIGGNQYCGGSGSTLPVNDSICHNSGTGPVKTSLCKDSADCDDDNSCTQDTCDGYRPFIPGDQRETLGKCVHKNLSPTTVCEGTSNNPVKLCSPGTDPFLTTNNPPSVPPDSPNYVPSTCSVDYIKCTNPKHNTSYCCGTTNIQGKQCQGYCRLAPFPEYPASPSETPPKAGIIVHADGNRCGISETRVTDSSGYAYFFGIPRVVGGSTESSRHVVYYEVWAEIPADTQFTRGTCYTRGLAGSVTTVSSGSNKATCDGRLSGSTSGSFAGFGFSQIFPAWIQTTGGDVHSNTRINTPGGP